MENLGASQFKLGIIAGGQLGKMLIQEASKWDIITYVLDSDKNCPAGSIASQFIVGSHLDFESVYQFGKMVDLLTLELENVNIDALKALKAEGLNISPDPEILGVIQDKGLQKEFYQKNGIPTANFKVYRSKDEIVDAVNRCSIRFPFVQKIRKGGYDGRGVVVINSHADLANLLEGPSVVEDKVEVAKEISVIVARNKQGELKSYPVVEMIFDPKANLVDKLISPSSITKEQSEAAVSIACKLADLLNLVGLLAVELFIDSSGEVIVNEMAPRPHNSGHHTIESVMTSQFEQHLRAILNLPLGNTDLKFPSVMLNILGDEGYEGPVLYEGLPQCLAIDGVKIHLYGKKVTKPYRKMGHVTILSDSVEGALKKAEIVKQLIKVRSWQKS